MPHFSRLTLASMLAVFALAGCAQKTATKSSTVTTSHTTTATTSGPATGAPASGSHHSASASRQASATATAKLPDSTGISACDDYLSSYVACHRAANIFAPDQLQGRYETMRTSLLQDSLNPAIRPQLAARCNSLASQLRDALHGKSCDANATPASTSP